MFTGNGPGDEVKLIGVEVKSVTDLISSMQTGRLQGTQLPGMLATYDVNWLLYYGKVRPGRAGELEIQKRGKMWQQMKLGGRAVPYGYLQSFLHDLTVSGMDVAHVYDEDEAAAWLYCLHRWYSKPWREHKGLHAFDRSRELSLMPGVDAATLMRAKVAAALPGLGFQRAVAAARYFGTIAKMIAATEEDWLKVEGIGKVVAGAVVRTINEN